MSVINFDPSIQVDEMELGFDPRDVSFGGRAAEAAYRRLYASLRFTDVTESEASTLKAMMMNLRGFRDQLALWDLQRPQPLGTYRGNLTLKNAVAAGDTQMTIVAANSNLALFPEANDNVYWGKTRTLPYGSGSGVNALIAPDGNLTAEKLVEDTQTGAHHTSRTFAMTAGAAVSWSGFIKAAERTKVQLQIGNSVLFATNASVRVNLLTGLIEFLSSSVVAASVTPAPLGWWRIAVKAIPPATGNDSAHVFMVNGANATSYAGDGASGLGIWGLKFENGDATDYGCNLTLKRGDWLGIGANATQQLLMVADDATSYSQGEIVVNFESPIRNAFPAGTQVIWDKPRALFRRQNSRLKWDYETVMTSGMTLDLIEDPRP